VVLFEVDGRGCRRPVGALPTRPGPAVGLKVGLAPAGVAPVRAPDSDYDVAHPAATPRFALTQTLPVYPKVGVDSLAGLGEGRPYHI
jgi:hypothetical protein